MKKQSRYWFLVFPLTIGVALGVMLLFRSIRISESIPANYLSLLELAFVSFLLPIYLVMIYSFIAPKNSFVGQRVIYVFVIVASILLASWIDYETWNTTKKKFLDAESRDITEIGLVLQFILALIVAGCTMLFSTLGKKPHNIAVRS